MCYMVYDDILSTLRRITASEDIKLDTPADAKHGDYATNVALVVAKRQGKSPNEVAQELVKKLNKDSELKAVVDNIEIAGPGFINFFVSGEVLSSQAVEMAGGNIAHPSPSEHKKVVVEYSSPNIAKPFGIGHFRSTIIGDAVANLLEATGWEVHRDNHLGDWGTQFGKEIYAIKTWGDEKELNESKNPVKELVALYIRFHKEAEKDPSLEDKAREWFKKLENGDEEARRLWQKCIDWSMKEFGRVYEVLGIKFTENDGVGYGESYFESKMAAVIEELSSKGLLKEGKEGAKLVFFEGDKLPPLMIVKKDGTTLYATRDLATDRFRLDTYGNDVVIINEVGAEQSLYFQQIYEIEKMLGWVKDGQRVHIKHGLFRFKDKKMSTRKGNTIWLEDVINEASEKARKFGSDEKLAKEVSVGALKWNELKRDPIKDIIFDWDEILSMEGNSGPYLQYTYARTKSLLSKKSFDVAQDDDKDINLHHQLTKNKGVPMPFDDKEKEVARVLIHYPEVVEDAAINYSPHVLTTYLFNLAQTFNSFYNSERVLGGEREEERLVLSEAVGQVIKDGLGLLGIAAPEKM